MRFRNSLWKFWWPRPQGQIGYMIESTLDSTFMELGINGEKYFISLITYVVVDENDPAFKTPLKPIGPVYTEEQAKAVPYPTRKTVKGYRRVVVSPEPVTVVEKREIRKLIDMDFIVICCGGGGIPVIREGRGFHGVDAVIDKDLVSAKLAEEVGADIFIIATDVPGAILNYGKPGEKILQSVTPDEVAGYLKEGHFPPGTMKPKIKAAMRFVQTCGKRAVISSIGDIEKAVEGKGGTEIMCKGLSTDKKWIPGSEMPAFPNPFFCPVLGS